MRQSGPPQVVEVRRVEYPNGEEADDGNERRYANVTQKTRIRLLQPHAAYRDSSDNACKRVLQRPRCYLTHVLLLLRCVVRQYLVIRSVHYDEAQTERDSLNERYRCDTALVDILNREDILRKGDSHCHNIFRLIIIMFPVVM